MQKRLVFDLTHSLNYIIMIVGRVRLNPRSLQLLRIRDQDVVCSHSLTEGSIAQVPATTDSHPHVFLK